FLAPTILSPLVNLHPTQRTHIYTLSLHDALPIFDEAGEGHVEVRGAVLEAVLDVAVEVPSRVGHGDEAHTGFDHAARQQETLTGDRKSTRLNSSHQIISYAVFCLKKKNTTR